MTDERDKMIERVAADLRELPMVDPSARARVLVAVAAERERSARARHGIPPRTRLAASMVGLVAAVLLVAWFYRPSSQRASDSADPASAAAPTIARPQPARFASDAPNGAALRQVQLVFRDPAARRVSVVGDFTDWDARQAPMVRDSASGLWSVTLALRPGRHVYAFLVDDSIWVQDPRAIEAPDADFGRPGSVLLVRQP